MSDLPFILNLYPPDCRPNQIEPLGNAGGMSGAQFWRLRAPRSTLILRRWPQEHPTPDRLRFIHAVLHHAAQRDIKFLPVPICATTGASFVEHEGHLWELAPWMPGTADYNRAPSEDKLRAAMVALAKFHVATADFDSVSQLPLSVGRKAELLPQTASSSPAIDRRLKLLKKLQAGGVDNLAHAITNNVCPELAPLAREFLSILPSAIPRALNQLSPLAEVRFNLQPCLRDIWHDHVLFTGNKVTGIIDFGALDIDTPACDIARLLGSLVPHSPPRSGEGLGEGRDVWQTGIAAYAAIRRLSSDETRTVIALHMSGTILAGCNWLRWIYVDRRTFENPGQVIERFRRISDRVSQPRSGGKA